MSSLNHAEKALKALSVYLERGREALRLASETRCDFDRLLELLRRRDMAFHNFNALDYQASVAGCDLAQHPEARVLWQAITVVNEELANQLRALQEEQQDELSDLQRRRRGIGGYHSGLSTSPKLVKIA